MAVYFLQNTQTQEIKVGYSGDPQRRATNLQCEEGVELELLGVMRGGRELEARLHGMLAPWHTRGEWFEPCIPLLEYINSNARPLRLLHLSRKRREEGADPRTEVHPYCGDRYLQKYALATEHCEIEPLEWITRWARSPGEVIAFMQSYLRIPLGLRETSTVFVRSWEQYRGPGNSILHDDAWWKRLRKRARYRAQLLAEGGFSL